MKLITTLIALMFCLFLAATTWEVQQDGSGHFTHIQDAIDAAMHSDSIKVFPGTYVENIDYNGKNIFIYSLEYTTGDPAYRDSTIIDGNRNGSVVKSITATTNCGIYGFTIQNGSGSPLTYYQGSMINLGGGIAIKLALQFQVSHCVISCCQAVWGGGLWLYQSTVFLSKTTITNNFASAGGGIHMSHLGQVMFDQINRCSVYDNCAGTVQDILAVDTRVDTNVYLDMSTINPPSEYYIYYQKSSPDWPGSFPVIDVQCALRSEVYNDMFVSPQGSDNNDGLSPSNPLKSIYRALQFVASDSLYSKTVHLSGGVYSSNEGQFFPLGMKPHVKLVGDVESLSILENLHYKDTIAGARSHFACIEKLTLEFGDNPFGGCAISFGGSKEIYIKDISISLWGAQGTSGLSFGSNNSQQAWYKVENVKISGINASVAAGFYSSVCDGVITDLFIDSCNVIGDAIPTNSLFYFSGNKLKMSNSRITNSSVADNDLNIACIGISGDEATRELNLDNVLIANNQTAGAPPVFIAAFNDNPGIINNCTFANNSGANYAVQLNGNFEVNNCIFDNDTPGEIRSAGSTSQLQFHNNFIRNYPLSTSFEALGNVNFNEVVLTGEPGFCSSLASEPLSYLLANSSICRDMGTPDTLGLHLPTTDLAGNPRIYGTAIDLGCYEWNYPVGLSDELSPPLMELRSFPNPFSAQHTLLFNLKAPGYLNCDIYNVKGQRVRSLADSAVGSGEQMLVWDGKDNEGRVLGSGIYFLKLRLNGREVALRRLVMAK